MSPYRATSAGDAPAPSRADAEDRMIAGVACVVGLIRVAIAIAAGEAFGAEASIATGLVLLGGWGLVRGAGGSARREP